MTRVRVVDFPPWQTRRTKAFIEDKISNPITIDQLATIVGLSASYFGSAFKASFGETPHSYILRMRITLARRLMLETSTPLSEIALASGMSDQSHFTRVFRRFIGMSPHAWRR